MPEANGLAGGLGSGSPGGGMSGGLAGRRSFGFADQQDSFGDDMLHRRETLELVRAYYRISDPNQRKNVFNLIKSMAPDAAE
jgi:hypothetical protein